MKKPETKATQQGMLKMFEDNVLFREFSEFCREENTTENIVYIILIYILYIKVFL